MYKTLEINFCFGLVCKVVVKVQRNSILFTCMGASHVQKKKEIFFVFFNLIKFFMNSLFFLHGHLFSFVFLLLFFWAMKRQESCTQNVTRICLLHEYLPKSFRFFT
jgi:hypothetical protein